METTMDQAKLWGFPLWRVEATSEAQILVEERVEDYVSDYVDTPWEAVWFAIYENTKKGRQR